MQNCAKSARAVERDLCGGAKESPKVAVRPEGADHQWRRIPPRELSIDLVADERFGRVTGRIGAS
jgi:hypothetical protein